MKVAITGHTKGLGRSVTEQIQKMGWEVYGFCRETGYDIRIPDHRKKIIWESKNCDIFINNAYSDYGQIDLLYEMYAAWKDQSKLIINIGSAASDAAEWRLKPCKYSIIKKALEVATRQLININHCHPCLKFFLFKPGYMNTSMVDYKKLNKWIEVESAAKLLIDTIKQISSKNITELTIRP